MKEIKFSHNYLKLGGLFCLGNMGAKLLQVIGTHYNRLSPAMREYDTAYCKKDGSIGHYALPKTDLILLIFHSDHTKQIFTTLRRHTPQKYAYYKCSEGEMFVVEITEAGES